MRLEAGPGPIPDLDSIPIASAPPPRLVLSSTTARLIAGLAIFAVYFLSAKIGLRFAFVHPSATAVWPPTGVSLAVFVILGYRLWPAIFLGALVANLTTAGSVATSLAIAIGNTLEGLVGAYLIDHFANGRAVFDRARDTARFVMLAALCAPLIAATIGVIAISAGGYAPWSEFPVIWITWWLGDATGALIVFPILLLWTNQPRIEWDQARQLEILLAMTALAAAAALIFGSWLPAHDRSYPLEFVSVPLLILIAFRLGVRETATAILVLAVFAIAGTLHGLGPFAHGTHNQALLLLQTFLGVIGITSISVAAEVAERRRLDEERTILLRAEQQTRAEAERSLAMLSRLQTVTTELPGESRDEILRELLTRLKSALDTDIGVVLLVQPFGDLLAACTVGFGEELAGNFSIPMGRGLAGRIAESPNGLIFTDLPHDDTLRSFFTERVKSVVGAPIRLNDTVIGVIEVGSFRQREYTTDDLALIQLVAHRVAFRIEQARLDEAERAARKAAEEANRGKDEFLAMLGHELRNPIGAISNAAHLLEQADARPDLAAKALGIIARQVHHTKRLVDDLLDVARVTSGRIILNRSSIDLAACVAECVNAMRATGEFDHRLFEFEASPVWVYADADRMAQVATNLLSNAIKYTPAGGRICVTVGPVGHHAELKVVDSGMGISPELLPRIFDLFTQGERTLERAYGGLGLGLTLVKKITERHGGSVTAASDGHERGSAFTVTLPRVEARDAPSDRIGAGLPMNAGPARIVVIEDNADVREGLQELLASLGHEVYVAQDGPSGVRETLARKPDFALVDIGLPGFDGFEVARRIRADTPESPVVLIAVTGYGQRESRQAAINAGFDHYLVKPIDLYSLANILGPPAPVASTAGGAG